MTLVDRSYPEIVRDVLTALTQGVAGEPHRVDYDPAARPVVIPDIVLRRRPARRISLVQGFVAAATPGDPPVHTVFSLNEYEAVTGPGDPGAITAIRFLPQARRRPLPGTDVIVNYYPRSTDPTPLTDLNVGSVVRTLVEAVSREIAGLYAQLNLAYDSAFVETATGASLDRVVALLDYRRFRAGRAIGAVTFSRRAGAVGSITIPAGTPVTDAADKVRYETSERRDMLPGESTAEVRIRGATAQTPPVEAGTLTVIQRAIAGLDRVVNERPTTRSSEEETDEELRARVRDALLAANRGTAAAIRNGLLQMPVVRDVQVTEMPNGIPGEIALNVGLVQPQPGGGLPPAVLERIEELRPAGIRVIPAAAGSLAVQVKVALVLAGSRMPPAEIEAVRKGVRERLLAVIGRKGVGERIRLKPLVADLLADDRIVDATLAIGPKGGLPAPAGEDFQPEPGTTLRIERGDISFESESFDQPLADSGRVPVEVRASLGAQPLPGVPLAQVQVEITQRLGAFLAALRPGTSVDAAAVLNALRNDAAYALDPLKLRLNLAAADQFAQVVQGGPAFQVLPGQVFTLAAVEVVP